MRILSAVLLLALTSCNFFGSVKYRAYPKNPYPNTRRIVVLPFVNQTRETRLDTAEFSNIFASEMVKFPGFEVIRPVIVQGLLKEGEQIKTVDDAVKLGRRLKADAILAVAITDYDPYNPPKVALSLQLLRTRARMVSAAEIDRLVQSGSWRAGPFSMSRGNAGFLIDGFERVWDAHNKNVRAEVRYYAEAQESVDTAYRDETEFIAVQSRWMQFVSNQAVNAFIKRALTHATKS